MVLAQQTLFATFIFSDFSLNNVHLVSWIGPWSLSENISGKVFYDEEITH
jgi:hypothetical protein